MIAYKTYWNGYIPPRYRIFKYVLGLLSVVSSSQIRRKVEMHSIDMLYMVLWVLTIVNNNNEPMRCASSVSMETRASILLTMTIYMRSTGIVNEAATTKGWYQYVGWPVNGRYYREEIYGANAGGHTSTTVICSAQDAVKSNLRAPQVEAVMIWKQKAMLFTD